MRIKLVKVMKILVIEDDFDVRENLVELLELSDYEVVWAENGEIGLAKAISELPDLIICDVIMPRMNGYEVLANLRQEPRTYNTPFLFLTAKADKLDIRKGMNLGADDYIPKPYSSKDLIESIETRLAKRKDLDIYIEQELNKVRNNIAISIPHEFRTPLNIILGFTQLLKMSRTKMGDEEIANILDSIENGGKRILKMVETITFLNKLNNSRKSDYSITKDICNPSDIIAENSITLISKMNRVEDVSYEIGGSRIFIRADFLEKITAQLVDNALKFSEKGDKIIIKSEENDNTYSIIFYNEGRGISKEQINMIGAFTQFDRDKYEQQGTGLGLEIVTKAIILFDGTIEITGKEDSFFQIKCNFKKIN